MRFRLLLLVSWWIGNGAVCGQTYFNQRYQIAAGYSFFEHVLPADSGCVAVGRGVDLGQLSALHVAMLDSRGVQRRMRRFGDSIAGYYPAYPGSFLPLPDGGRVLLTERIAPGPPQTRRRMLWRFNAHSDTLWTRTYSFPTENGSARNLTRLASGDFVLVGAMRRAGPSGYTDWYALRTDSGGVERWRHNYSLLDNGEPVAALATADGGVLVTGYTYINHPGQRYVDDQLTVLKIDSLGAVQWQRLYPVGTGGSQALATPAGGYLIAGYQLVRHHTPSSSWLLERATLFRLDSLGTPLSQRSYGPATGIVTSNTFSRLADGSYVISGTQEDSMHTAQTGMRPVFGFGLKVCADGDSVWWRDYRKVTGIRSSNYLFDFRPAPDGGFVGAGNVNPVSPDMDAPAEAWAFKADSAGNLVAGGPPPARGCPRPVGLAVPVESPAVAVWPNPAPDGRYTVGGLGPGVALEVRDALGRRVWHGPAGRGPETVVDLGRQPAGLYSLRLTWPDGRMTTNKLLR